MTRTCALLLTGVLAACTGTVDDLPSGDSDRLSGEVVVSAAASLTDVFEQLAVRLEDAHPDLTVRLNLAGSQTLVAQVLEGAPVDVLATAAEAPMQRVVDAGLVDPGDVRRFATNHLAIAVETGNPRGIEDLADLARDDLVVVLPDPGVPAGSLAADVLGRAGVTVHPASLELDVRAALRKVAAGEADAAIVYATDVLAAADTVDAVPIRASDEATTGYPIAVLDDARNPAAAEAFVALLASGAGQRLLADAGFEPDPASAEVAR